MDIRFLSWSGYQLAPCEGYSDDTSAVYHIWNGTGPLDIGGDWVHSGYGVETEESKHDGTNGLDASGIVNQDEIYFTSPVELLVSPSWPYDYLTFWVNIREWNQDNNYHVLFHYRDSEGNIKISKHIDLPKYMNTIEALGQWQKLNIPMSVFEIGGKSNTADFHLTKLNFHSRGNGTPATLWFDDIYFSMTTLVSIPICSPDMTGNEYGVKGTASTQVTPSMKVYPQIQVSPRKINTFPPPSVS